MLKKYLKISSMLFLLHRTIMFSVFHSDILLTILLNSEKLLLSRHHSRILIDACGDSQSDQNWESAVIKKLKH